MNFDQTLQELGSVAIPGASTTCNPARYEPEFEQMQAEIDKLIALEGGATDWTLVSECASTLLAKKSKDLLCAAYLCAALRETRGWSGLADGLNVIKALVTTHWDALHPERLRARKTAVDWLLDRIKPLAETTDAQASDQDALSASIALLDELVAFGETRWEGDPPTLWALTKILKEKLNAVPAPVSESAVEATSSSAARSTTTSSASTTSFAAASAGGLVDRQAIYRQILALAEQLIANEPHSPVPYLLRRAAAWGPMALPQLYAELQRSGSMWDLVLQQLPEGFAALPAAGSTAAPSSVSSQAPTPAPAPTSPRPRGDY
jgi:type VI secretion system protein VasJ